MTREEAIEYIKGFLEGRLHSSYTGDAIVPALEYAVDALEYVRHGHWVDRQGEVVKLNDRGCITGEMVFCSECGEYLDASDEYSVRGRFCPSCGAKMEGTPVKHVKRWETYNGDFDRAWSDYATNVKDFVVSQRLFANWLMEEIKVEK